jgi:Domain of unknown function (DUF4224)
VKGAHPFNPDRTSESAMASHAFRSNTAAPHPIREEGKFSYHTAKHSLVADNFFCMLISATPCNISNRGIILSLCLTKEEIRELTLKVRYAAQVRALSEMGVHHTLRPDGSPVVLHSTLTELMGAPKRKPNQPDFSSLGQ